jgi:hypothetical protein
MGQFEDLAGGQALGLQGELRERQRQQVVELVEEPRALAGDGLQPAGDLAECAQGE